MYSTVPVHSDTRSAILTVTGSVTGTGTYLNVQNDYMYILTPDQHCDSYRYVQVPVTYECTALYITWLTSDAIQTVQVVQVLYIRMYSTVHYILTPDQNSDSYRYVTGTGTYECTALTTLHSDTRSAILTVTGTVTGTGTYECTALTTWCQNVM